MTLPYDASATARKRYRYVELVRGTWGVVLFAAPERVLGMVHGLRVDAKSLVVGRILGARHLTQASLSGLRPSPEVLAMGVWVDAVHALTALGLAVIDPRRARAGLTDTAIAAVWAAVGYRDLKTARATPPEHQRMRDRLAITMLSRAPAGLMLRRQIGSDRREGFRESSPRTLSK